MPVKGAHLPGFPAKQAGWLSDDSCNPLKQGISQAGIKAYRATFELNLPVGSDLPLALKFTRTPSSRYRSVIFINGWQFGRFSSADGPQTVFPVSITIFFLFSFFQYMALIHSPTSSLMGF
ncbi:MAG TPA: beta galactosidase jelly roll domain-containing protein [Chlamydiales bacterium]|jgi:hypothetical protein|nr:beta galactosidase jelly roll domain-containing protein [Chlamydiales bacterium]